jgi:hypothetical protein
MRTCLWHRCRRPLEAIRASRPYCSVRCRVAHHRTGRYAQKLRACRVELIGRVEAVSVIVRYEKLGTVGNATIFFGLRTPGDRFIGVVGFGHGAHAARVGCDAVLERGWTHRSAPRNSGSHLIARALRYGRRYLGWRVAKAYSDQGSMNRGCFIGRAGSVRTGNWA